MMPTHREVPGYQWTELSIVEKQEQRVYKALSFDEEDSSKNKERVNTK